MVNREGEKCRILYIVGQLGLGGAERQLLHLLGSLDRSRYIPCVAVWNYSPHEKYYRDIAALKVPIYGLPEQGSSISKLLEVRKLARRLAPEVIHSYMFFTNFVAEFAARTTGAIALGSLRSDIARSMKTGGVIRGMLNRRWPDYQISNSVACAEAAKRHSLFFVPTQYIVVRNGLDLNAFQPVADSPASCAYVASVGSLIPVKRWDRLLYVAQCLRGKGLEGVRFRLAGEGLLRPVLERLAKELDVAKIVEFLGAVHDIPAFLQGAKFLLHTSESEGCPNAVMEAMAAGRAVIATDVGDVSHLVEDGKTGFVVRQEDDEMLAERIVTLLTNPDLCCEMGKNARARAEQEFRLSSLVKGTLNAYRAAGWKDVGYD